MDAYDPELNAQDRFILTEQQEVFVLDALKSATPVSTEVRNPEFEIAFDRLSYGKASCLLRMIQHSITQDTFQAGVYDYLTEYEFDNADRTDLWQKLNDAAHESGTLTGNLDLSIIMEGWATKAGYPVITVTDVTADSVTVTQNRFFTNTEASPSDHKWFVPISVCHPGDEVVNTNTAVWLTETEDSHTVLVDKKPFLLNPKGTGYYRVNYDEASWYELREILITDHTSIDRVTRAQLVDDSMNLARAKLLDYPKALEISEYLVFEYDYIPLKAGIDNLRYLFLMFREVPEDLEELQGYMTMLLGDKFDEYGFSAALKDTYMDALIREELISIMCLFDYGDCVSTAQYYFNRWISESDPDNNNPIPVDIKAPVYKTAILNGGDTEWDFLFQRFKGTNVDGEKARILHALGMTRNEVTMELYLNKTIDETSGIEKENTRTVYRAIGSTIVGRELQMTWLENNYLAIKIYFGPNFSDRVNDILFMYAEGSRTQAEIDRLRLFWIRNKEDAIANSLTTILQGVDTTITNLNWLAGNRNTVLGWLRDINDATPSLPPTTTEAPPPPIPSELSLKIERPSLVAAGEPASLRCRLAASNVMDQDTTCKFLTPDGRTLVVDFTSGEVVDGSGGSVDGYQGFQDTAMLTCGLDITAVDSIKDHGQWACIMNENKAQFHKGSFHLIDPDMGFVSDIRLPRHLEPFAYTVELTPFFESRDYTVDGFVRAVLRHDQNVENDFEYINRIVFHCKDIIIDENLVEVLTARTPNTIVGHEYDLEREFYVIHVEEDLWQEVQTTFHYITIKFTSFLNDGLSGFYRSSYVDESGDTKELAVSQFWATDARRAFPCLDEPDMKARFLLRLGHMDNMTAVSNTDITATYPLDVWGSNYVMDHFRMTPKMSTYLVAFLVSDFVNTTTSESNFNIIHQYGKEEQARLAANSGPQILKYYEDYFDIQYVLPKTDMAAIPDFSFGAMENWGLITYKESALLYDTDVSSQRDRSRVIEIIAHELAHMWFGNLVTMEWWTDLWLNEGTWRWSFPNFPHIPLSLCLITSCFRICYLCGEHRNGLL